MCVYVCICIYRVVSPTLLGGLAKLLYGKVGVAHLCNVPRVKGVLQQLMIHYG